jgi:hypothetical protein
MVVGVVVRGVVVVVRVVRVVRGVEGDWVRGEVSIFLQTCLKVPMGWETLWGMRGGMRARAE